MLWMTSALNSIRRRVSSKQRPFPPALTWLTAVLTLMVLAGTRSLAQDVTGTFVPIEVPGASFTVARAITADGRIVGFYGMVNGPQHGFLLAPVVLVAVSLVLFVAAMMSAAIPAYRAASIQPVDALRTD